jgi:hypothetical protein
MEKVRSAVSDGPPGLVAHNIMRNLVGNTAPADDIALLVFHTTHHAGATYE